MKELEKAIKERDLFLEKHPNLIPIQKKIDKILNTLPKEARLGMIFYLLADSVEELYSEIILLENIIKKIDNKNLE